MKKPSLALTELLARLFLFLLLAAAGFGAAYGALSASGRFSPAGPQTVTLHAAMPENGGWSLETLTVAAGQPLRLRLTSDDVMHSFAVGQSGAEPLDLLPGEWRDLTLSFERPGRYTYYCTRWCGRSHWRMRGTILVTGDGLDAPTGAADAAPAQPLYLRLGLDLDAPHPAEALPAQAVSATRGAALAGALPAWALDRQTYLENSPSALWLRLRAEPGLQTQPDSALWDAVAFLWDRQAPADQTAAARLYASNCAACHGEAGRGDGVMVAGLPRFDPSGHTAAGESGAHMDPDEMVLSAPPDFTDPRVLLGASPALLEGKLLRGGMGTGMPYWGPIFTQAQLDALVAYLYTFALPR